MQAYRQRLFLWLHSRSRLIRILYAIHRLHLTPLWEAAHQAVYTVARDSTLNHQVHLQSTLPFCPRCGQSPGLTDRRFDEARELALLKLSEVSTQPSRADLDFAIIWHYWTREL